MLKGGVRIRRGGRGRIRFGGANRRGAGAGRDGRLGERRRVLIEIGGEATGWLGGGGARMVKFLTSLRNRLCRRKQGGNRGSR